METAIMSAMCRCCASEGVFKDVKSSYTWMGDEEVYADMLRECFDIHLSTSEHCEDGGICEVCITQLRNASNFKKQVLHTEEQFKKHINNKLFKPSIVKVEVSAEEDNDSDDNNMSAEEAYSGPEFEIPIKTETEEPKPKKRAASSKATTSRAKKAKGDSGESSSKHTRKCSATSEILPMEPQVTKKLEMIEIKPRAPKGRKKKLKIIKIRPDEELNKPQEKHKWVAKSEVDQHKHNIRTIICNSNATPIGRYGGIGYGCCFCSQQFETPRELKNHTITIHDNCKTHFMDNVPLVRFIVKLDITNLSCTLCQMNITRLDSLIEHLKSIHDKHFHEEINSRILPFKFDSGDIIKCVVCNNNHNNYKVLLEHMNTHFNNYMCNICGAGFVNRKILLAHAARHKTGEFVCSFCSKIFNTLIKKKEHERAIHVTLSLRSKCGYCGEKFSDYTKKNNHEVKIHGAKPVVLKCQACQKTFSNQRSLTAHTKIFHLMAKRLSNK